MRVNKTITVEVPVGMYVVEFETIWGTHCNEGQHDDCLDHGCMDNEPSYVAEIDGSVTKSTKKNFVGEGLTLDSNTTEQYDDTHDLRPRVFKTKKEADVHLKSTLDKFKNPLPWQSFVKVS